MRSPPAIASSLALTGAGAILGAVAFTIAVGVAFAAAGALACTIAGAGAGAGAIAGALGSGVSWNVRQGHAALGYAVLFSTGLLGVFLPVLLVEPVRASREALGLLMFLAVFPILSGFFDVLSLGVTRALLHRGVRRRGLMPFLLGIVHVVCALGFFAVLDAAFLLAVAAMNWAAGLPVLDLRVVFADLAALIPAEMRWWQTARGDEIWLHVMVFCKLLPSPLHASVAMLSLFRYAPFGARRGLIASTRAVDGDARRTEVPPLIGLSLLSFAAGALPIAGLVGLGYLIVSNAPLTLQTYRQVFQIVARRLGQIDEIGPVYLPASWTGVTEV